MCVKQDRQHRSELLVQTHLLAAFFTSAHIVCSLGVTSSRRPAVAAGNRMPSIPRILLRLQDLTSACEHTGRVEKYRPCRERAGALRITGAWLLAVVQTADGFVRLQKHNTVVDWRKIRSRPRLLIWINLSSSTILSNISQAVKGRRPLSERNGHFTLCLLFVISSHSWS